MRPRRGYLDATIGRVEASTSPLAPYDVVLRKIVRRLQSGVSFVSSARYSFCRLRKRSIIALRICA